MGLYVSARRFGGNIKLANLGSHANEVLQITKFMTVFEVFDKTEDAIASFNIASSGRQSFVLPQRSQIIMYPPAQNQGFQFSRGLYITEQEESFLRVCRSHTAGVALVSRQIFEIRNLLVYEQTRRRTDVRNADSFPYIVDWNDVLARLPALR